MRFIDAHDFPVGLVLRVLDIASSTYYDWRARALLPARRRREDAELLALIDPSPAAEDRTRVDVEDSARVAALFAQDQARLAGASWVMEESLIQQGSEAVLQALLDEGHKAGLLVPEVGLTQLQTLFSVFAANLRALAHYRPSPIAGRITMLRASEGSADADRGWGGLAEGGLELTEVPGDHYGVLRAPGVQELAERLTALLRQVRQKEDAA